MRDKVDKLLGAIDELQASESSKQLSARRAERELREEREKSLRLEREVEGWKMRGGGSVAGSVGRKGTWRNSGEGGVEVPRRKSSVGRVPSLTKGFL